MRRLGIILPATLLGLLLTAGPTLACGGLIGPNGAVNLLRTTTFAGYHDGVEHYITVVPVRRRRRGLRLDHAAAGRPDERREGRRLDAPAPDPRDRRRCAKLLFAADAASAAASAGAEELMKVRIDALDITVLRGGAADIGTWASDHGFRLPPDAPEVLDFYAERSPIFLAAAFDADAAAERGQQVGDGTPVHITIPTDNPWVPLRILALGKTGTERVDADVYLLTDAPPALLPRRPATNGMRLDHSAARQREPPRRPALRPGHGVGPDDRPG